MVPGAGRRASAYAWNGIWASLALAPVFIVIALLGSRTLPLLGLEPEMTRYAVDFWEPRMGGAFLGLVLWSMQSFFNGVSRVRTTLAINLVVAVANAALNDLLILRLGYGIAGSGWATCLAQLIGVLIGLYLMLATAPIRDRFAAHLTWRPRWQLIGNLIGVGLGIGAMVAFDILGMAVFQIMMTRLGVLDGAATQIVMMLTSVAFMPAVGLGMAGTTLVGQAIGAGDRAMGIPASATGSSSWPPATWEAWAWCSRWPARGCCPGSSVAPATTRPRWSRSASACSGSPPATSSSTGCSWGRGSACAGPATRAFPR